LHKGIPSEIIDEIQQKNDIVSVVEQYLSLEKKSAQNYFGLCPFHAEKTPSFSVSPQKQIYYCFGCHKGGNVINFLMDIEKIGYLDAIKMLAEKSGVKIPESDDKNYRERVELEKTLFGANTEAARYYYKNLISDRGYSAREYLKRRGIENKTVKKFGLGFAINEWEGLYNHLKSCGYDDNIIFMTGLFKKRDSAEKGMYDLLRNRLIFPIFDYLGRIVAFGGRVLDDSMPKYINSPETQIYTKGKHLYGYHIAKSSVRDRIIVVEGYLDAIAIHQAGIDNAVASLGTALTQYQAVLLRKHSQEVVIAYDADAAGQAAAMRGMDILSGKDCKVFVLRLPEGKDPDDYIRKNGSERFEALIKKALPFMDYKLEIAYEKSFTEDQFDSIKYQEIACDVLAKEKNKIVRELYADKVATVLGISMHSVIDEIERQERNNQGNPKEYKLHNENISTTQAQETEEKKTGTATKEELFLLCLLATDPRIFTEGHLSISTKVFSPGIMEMIAKAALEKIEKNLLTPASLIELGSDNMVNKRKLSELFASGCMKTESIKNIKQAVNEAERLYSKVQIQFLLKEKDIVTQALQDPHITKEEKDKTRNKLLEIQKNLGSLKMRLNE